MNFRVKSTKEEREESRERGVRVRCDSNNSVHSVRARSATHMHQQSPLMTDTRRLVQNVLFFLVISL